MNSTLKRRIKNGSSYETSRLKIDQFMKLLI